MERSADWIEQAQGDLAHARSDVEGRFYDWASFSSQQAAEKAAKAVLQRLGGEAWGHSVADLLTEVGKTHSVSEALLDAALELDKAYIPARYPDAHPSGSPTDGTLALKQRGWWSMLNTSSGSVKTFYPPADRPQVVALLRERVPALAAVLPVQRAVLFGSWATDRATAFSDVDVLIVYAGPPREDAFKMVRRCLDVRGLEPHVYAEAEAVDLRSTLDRMTRGGISLM